MGHADAARAAELQLPFNEAKVTQAAALFLKLRGGRMHYLKLIKLLYITDRKALRRWGFPVTMDQFVAMDHGPVVSRTFNLIQGVPAPTWNAHISAPMGEHEVELRGEGPGTSLLSEDEEKLIREVFHEYGHRNRWELVEITHRFPEWRNPDGSSLPIGISDILEAFGESESEIEAQIEILRTHAAASQAFGKP